MGYQAIEVRKTTPNIGAEILGVDLSKARSAIIFESLEAAL